MTMPLVQCFNLKPQDVVTIVGSGGKTTLLWQLATSFPGERTLVTTTTKLFREDDRPFSRQLTSSDDFDPSAPPGVTLFARPWGEVKLTGPEPNELTAVLPHFDHSFIEGDGSKERPLKGWGEGEPVIPAETTVTIGVLPITALGLTFNDDNVFRPAAFETLTGLTPGAEVNEETLVKIITSPEGLFKHARGRRILFLNHCEDEKKLCQAGELAKLLKACDFELDTIVAGSALSGTGLVL